MRLHTPSPLLLSFLLSTTSAITLDCSHVRVGGKSFDFSALGGPRSVMTSVDHPPAVVNTTYTVDICQPLKRTKGVPKTDECASGTRVCGIERTINSGEDNQEVTGVYPIAGDYTTGSGRSLDPSITRLKATDSEAEGIRLELNGGRYPFEGKKGRTQKAVIEFVCDHDKTGLEGLGDADQDEEEDDRMRMRRADELEVEEPKAAVNASLVFKSYGAVDDIDVLRLDWFTKYACEDVSRDDDKDGEGDDNGDKSGEVDTHWGFFTWFILILFLSVAAYLIFGGWLNYSRYGARGWDLVPHGDTIRDVPYLMKDWSRKVVNTVQGGGSRGGYSAV